MKRYQYNQITKAEPHVVRYRLYKAKKQWVVQGMTTVALLLGVHEAQVHGVPGVFAPDITTAKADTVDGQADPTAPATPAAQSNQATDQPAPEGNTPTATVAPTAVSEQGDQATQTPTQPVTTSSTDQTSVTASTDETPVATPTATVETTTPTATTDTPTGTLTATSTPSQAASQTVQTQSDQTQSNQTQLTPKTTATAVKTSTAKATTSKAATIKIKSPADFNRKVQKMTNQAQKITKQVNQVVKADAKQANAKTNDRIVHNSGLDALSAHVNNEFKQVKLTLSQPSTQQAQKLAAMQATLTQANNLLKSMRTELVVANKMLVEDKRGVNARFVSDAKATLNQLVLPADTTAKVDEYGDLVVTTNQHTSYQAVLNQLTSKGLTKQFRNVVDPTQLYYGISSYSDAELLAQAKLNIDAKLAPLKITQDVSDSKEPPFYQAANITYYNSLVPYWQKLQTAYNSGSAADMMLAAAEYLGAVQAIQNYSDGQLGAGSDQKQATDNTSFALIMNVDEYDNPIFTETTGRVKAGDLLNHAGVVVDPTNSATDTGSYVNTLLSPSGLSTATYFVGKVGDDIANPTIKATVPNFTYQSTDYSTGQSKLVDITNGKTLQVVVNHWTSSATPVTTAIKATVGDVTKVEDGTPKFTAVPKVTLSDATGTKLTVPDLFADDFDWSQVKAAPASYPITLNGTGIQKILAANPNTTLATKDITAGHAIITEKAATAIKATVGDVTRVEDGTPTFATVPKVTLSDAAGSTLTVPTNLTTADFDWSQVKSAPASYSITLNDDGIQKILAANPNTTLAVADITAGHAIITAKAATAIKAAVGDVTKVEDGTPTFATVPTVTLSDAAGAKLTVPDLTTDDFDWSQVKAAPDTYTITLNVKGIQKIEAANENTTLAVEDVTAGHAIITPRAATAIKATVGNVTKDYDGTINFNDIPTVELSGQSKLTTPTFTATDFDWSSVKADAGTYKVTLNATGMKKITDDNANTTLAASDVTAGQVTINQAAITITAVNVSKTQGQVDPKLTATVSGKPASGAAVQYTVSRDAGETPGTYAIKVTASEKANPNYAMTVKDGTFTISPVDELAVTVGNIDKTYDGTGFDTKVVPTVTLAGGDKVNTPTFVHDDFDWDNVKADAGTYSVTLNAAGLEKIADANKGAKVNVVAGNAVIKQAAVTITANDATKVVGQKDPELSATVTGKPAAGAPLVYTVSRAAGETAAKYDITVTATTVANPNYLITTAKGTFTITAADTFNWTAHYVDGDGHQVADPVSGTDLHAGDAYKTTAKYVDGYYLTAEPANATGTIKAGDVTVTYVYHKVGSFTVTSPSGQTTTIAYSVDHDDPTKVAAPAGQVVPYVKGYDAIGPDGKLTLVDPADPTQGYVLPAITQAGQPTAITYVAVNNGGNGGNSGNSGNNTNDNQASGTVTPTTNNAGTTTNQTNNETNSTPVTTDQTASQSSNQKKSTTAKQTKPAARAAQKQATGKQAVQKRATAAKANGKTGQSTISRNAATLKPGRSALANQSGKQGVSAAKLGSTNRSGQAPSGQSQVETATMLPQTGDASSTTLTWLGAMLAGFLGLFGLKRRRRG